MLERRRLLTRPIAGTTMRSEETQRVVAIGMYKVNYLFL